MVTRSADRDARLGRGPTANRRVVPVGNPRSLQPFGMGCGHVCRDRRLFDVLLFGAEIWNEPATQADRANKMSGSEAKTVFIGADDSVCGGGHGRR